MAETSGVAKAGAAVIAGSVTTILVYVIHAITGQAMPPEIEQAIQTLITAGAVFFTPHSFGET